MLLGVQKLIFWGVKVCSKAYIYLFLTHSEKKLHKHFKKGIGGNCQFNNLNDIRDDDGCL